VALVVALGVAGIVALVVFWREKVRLKRESELAVAEGQPLRDD
jgi:hypothetical protein